MHLVQGSLLFCSDISCGREGEFLGVRAGRTVTDGGGWNRVRREWKAQLPKFKDYKRPFTLTPSYTAVTADANQRG